MTVDIHFKTEIRNAVVLGVVATIYYYEQHGNFNMSRGRLQALDHIANTFDISWEEIAKDVRIVMGEDMLPDFKTSLDRAHESAQFWQWAAETTQGNLCARCQKINQDNHIERNLPQEA